MKPSIHFFVIICTLFACTSSKLDTSTTDDTEANQPSSEPSGEPSEEPGSEPSDEPGWAPVNGHWTYGSGQLIENTCSDDSGGNTDTDPAGFTLSTNGGNEIVLTPDGSTDTVTCVLTNMDFDCQKTNAEVTVPIEGIDFHLNIETASNGFFSDDSNMTTLFTLTTTCLDVDWNIFDYDCGDANNDGYLPCTVKFSAEATAD